MGDLDLDLDLDQLDAALARIRRYDFSLVVGCLPSALDRAAIQVELGYLYKIANAAPRLIAALRAERQRVCATCRFRRNILSSPSPMISQQIDVCGKVSIPGHSVAIVACDSLGNTCGSWEAKS